MIPYLDTSLRICQIERKNHCFPSPKSIHQILAIKDLDLKTFESNKEKKIDLKSKKKQKSEKVACLS